MHFIALLFSLAVVDLLAAISPGPNFVLVSQSAAHRSRRYAFGIVLGLVVSNFIWCLAVVFGLASLFKVAPWLYTSMKVLGGAYLVFLGVQLWRGGDWTTQPNQRTSIGSQTAMLRGILTNLGNPKSVVYFGSIFAVFIAPGTPLWVLTIAVTIVLANTVLWYGTVAWLFSSARFQKVYSSLQRPFSRVAGGLMAAFGARLIFVTE
jgi:threonine efflux protein